MDIFSRRENSSGSGSCWLEVVRSGVDVACTLLGEMDVAGESGGIELPDRFLGFSKLEMR